MEKVRVEHLDFYYGSHLALSGISIPIQEHQITALIGPSGCGKSTFLRCLNRMNDTIRGTRVSGQVLLDGQDIYDPKTDVVELRKRVGMVFQRPNCFGCWDGETEINWPALWKKAFAVQFSGMK